MAKSMTEVSINLAIVFLITTVLNFDIIVFCSGHSRVLCVESEKQALMRFKNLSDPSERLISWGGKSRDCCEWVGVVCNNITGNVEELRLRNPLADYSSSTNGAEYKAYRRSALGGMLNPSLLDLKNLSYLDLSGNYFDWIQMTSFIGDLVSLKYLDLSFSGFTGRLPRSFENLCNLKELRLSGIKLGGDILEVLDIFSGCILDELETLDLRSNQLSGHFSDVVNLLGQSKKLASLSLSNNSLFGQVPSSLGRLSFIKYLDLSDNKLSGHLPESLGQLADLEVLLMSGNLLQGVMSEVHFANLTQLQSLDGSRNQLFLSVSPNWVPRFQLQSLVLRSCPLQTPFPHWLHSQKNLRVLDISHTGIFGTIPRWFWNLSPQIGYLNLSHNHIQGELINKPLVFEQFATIDLSSNHLNGTLPRLSPDIMSLDLSDNSFSGSISHFLCYKMDELKLLQLLNLERNLLSGELTNCWESWYGLEFINLRKNNLSGKIPSSMGSLNFLKSLHLQSNGLSGKLPPSLQNCTTLVSIDFGENEFSGSIPTWIGERLPNLKILILRSNKFHSNIPKELCGLGFLQILDLGRNNLSGSIPTCFMNLSAMAIHQNSSEQMSYKPAYPAISFEGFLENAELVMKRQTVGYSTILHLVTSMDLSSNTLSGEIPKELMSLQGLRSLNLSSNLLTGRIPENIGVVEQLESVDFSMNHLFGEIPSSMSSLTFLSHLNLSYNNLSGKIPSSTQLQSFDAFSFVGNSLCGPPVNSNCNVYDTTSAVKNVEGRKGDTFEVDWFYATMALGFVVGFWGVVGPFLFNNSWRFVCFQFMDSIWYRFCGVICTCG
ncbi:receptor-like protein EIX2 [Cornus florida]|uniref:receptor-like protein EIX2 n=1 Tax=Cornus florida TaxID=4283 RepID=UPI00289F5097|nr:receptor-like protein EIX2 [Cornus florida]